MISRVWITPYMVQQSPCNSQWHATGAAASDLSRPTAVKWCRHQLPSRYWTVQTDCSGEENQWWGSHQEGIRPSHLQWERHPGNIPVSRSTIAAPEIVGHNSSLDVLRYEMDAGSPGVFVLWLVADGENDSNHSTSNVHTSKLIEKQLPVHHIRQGWTNSTPGTDIKWGRKSQPGMDIFVACVLQCWVCCALMLVWWCLKYHSKSSHWSSNQGVCPWRAARYYCGSSPYGRG